MSEKCPDVVVGATFQSVIGEANARWEVRRALEGNAFSCRVIQDTEAGRYLNMDRPFPAEKIQAAIDFEQVSRHLGATDTPESRNDLVDKLEGTLASGQRLYTNVGNGYYLRGEVVLRKDNDDVFSSSRNTAFMPWIEDQDRVLMVTGLVDTRDRGDIALPATENGTADMAALTSLAFLREMPIPTLEKRQGQYDWEIMVPGEEAPAPLPERFSLSDLPTVFLPVPLHTLFYDDRAGNLRRGDHTPSGGHPTPLDHLPGVVFTLPHSRTLSEGYLSAVEASRMARKMELISANAREDIRRAYIENPESAYLVARTAAQAIIDASCELEEAMAMRDEFSATPGSHLQPAHEESPSP